jgi:hypothetical protein
MKLSWDQIGERLFETGVDRGVVYPMENGAYTKGAAWNGLVNVNENPSGAEPTPLYADNIKYLNLISSEDFGANVESYTYPDEFSECIGETEIATGVKISQQKRKAFGFSYRSLIGNDTDGSDYGYKIHLVYGCLAAPSERAHNTINESPEAGTLSWDISTTPVDVPGHKPTAHIEIDSTKCNADELEDLEDILYGTAGADARLPLPAELLTIFSTSVITE